MSTTRMMTLGLVSWRQPGAQVRRAPGAVEIEPDDGDATIAGADLRRGPGEVRRRTGYVAQGGSTWDDVSAREELVLHARMYGISKVEALARAAKAAARRSGRRRGPRHRVLCALALLFGLRPVLGYLLLAYLMLALISMMTSALSYGVSLAVRDENALAPLMNTVAMPVFLLSGILLPISAEFGAPDWLVNIARFNPFSWAVDGVRALFAGDLDNDRVWQGLLITAVLAVLAVIWAARSFARSVR